MTKTSHRKPVRRTAVVVLSMHRSGTSALTRVLSLLGCTLPKTLIAGRKNDNDTGFWESQAVVDVNEAICASTGSNWNDWLPLSQSWLSSPVRHGVVDQAHEVLKSEFGDSRFFVLKDPRLCRLMPVWVEALERFDARPVYVLPVRNPFEVAASLRKRNQLVEGDTHLAWLRHMLDAERHSRGQPRVFTRYDELLGNWRKVVDRISDKLDLPWPNRSMAAEDEIDAFLTPDLRHNSAEDSRVFEDVRLSPWIRQCYDVMSRWARGEVRDGDMETLDRVNAEMDAAVPAFGSIVAETRSLGRMRRELVKRLEVADAASIEQRKALEAADATVREQRKALEVADATAREQREALEAARAELIQLRDRLSQADRTLAQRRTELDKTTGELEKLHAELTERDERLRSLEARRADEREEVRLAIYHISQEANDRLVERESALGAARQEAKNLRDHVSEAEAELEQARAELAGQLQHSKREMVEITAQAKGLLNDYMRCLHREVYPPAPGILSRLDPLQRFRLRKSADTLRNSAEELRGSVYFDAEWYLARNADVASAGMDPALHFIQHGFQEGRAPSARFEEAR